MSRLGIEPRPPRWEASYSEHIQYIWANDSMFCFSWFIYLFIYLIFIDWLIISRLMDGLFVYWQWPAEGWRSGPVKRSLIDDWLIDWWIYWLADWNGEVCTLIENPDWWFIDWLVARHEPAGGGRYWSWKRTLIGGLLIDWLLGSSLLEVGGMDPRREPCLMVHWLISRQAPTRGGRADPHKRRNVDWMVDWLVDRAGPWHQVSRNENLKIWFVSVGWLIGCFIQCCGSMTFWCESGSAESCIWLMDPDLDSYQDPVLFFSSLTFKMPTKK
jgi:hypothetical protein